MPRRLLRDRLIVADDWLYSEEWPADQPASGAPNSAAPGSAAPNSGAPSSSAAAPDARAAPTGVILSFDQWSEQRPLWWARAPRLGVVLTPEIKVEQLAAELKEVSLVACNFSGPSEGRGYSQGRLLRERYDFQGELRAMGYVRIDQLFFLARCGFNSFELPDTDLAAADAAFSTFTAAYQPANDRGLPLKLPHA